MKERPILFSGPMVRAILEGRKSQTRRVVRGSPAHCFPMLGVDNQPNGTFFVSRPDSERVGNGGVRCPFGAPGDRLWVKETCITSPKRWSGDHALIPTESRKVDHDGDVRAVQYLATAPNREGAADWGLKTTPSIYMPRWASRITLEVTDVRVERLQDISEADARAEGVEVLPAIRRWRNYVRERESSGIGETVATAREAFASLWESIHGTESWAANPWVWVVSFRRLP